MYRHAELLESVNRLVLGDKCLTRLSALQSQLRLTQERMDVLRLRLRECEKCSSNNSYWLEELYKSRHEYEDVEREHEKLAAQLRVAQTKRERESGEAQEEHTCEKCRATYQCDSKQFQKLISLVAEANRLASDLSCSERLDETADVCKNCLQGFVHDLGRVEVENSRRVGAVVKGRVKNVQQYGAFVELDGVTGFLYVGEMRWGFTDDARNVVSPGQEITVKVIDIDRSFDPPRFNLSLRQLQPKPDSGSDSDSPQISADQSESPVTVSTGQAVPKDKDILIDGSNIVRWFPELKSKALCMVMAGLEKAGYNAYIIFDATIPYVLKEAKDKVGQAFLDFLRESKPECVKIVPADSQADDFILSYANAHGNHIVSNDRYKQYVSRYPWVGNKNEQGRRVHRVEEIKGEIVLPTLGISVQSSGRQAKESLKIRWTKTSISPLRVEILQAFVRYLSGGDFVAVSQAEDEFFKASGIATVDFIGRDLGQLLRMPIGRQFFDEQGMNGEVAQHMVRSRLTEECHVDSERLRVLIDTVRGLVGSALPEDIQFDQIASKLQVKRCLMLLAYVYAAKEGRVR